MLHIVIFNNYPYYIIISLATIICFKSTENQYRLISKYTYTKKIRILRKDSFVYCMIN